MILALITIVEQPQVFLGTGEVIFDAAPDPLVFWMRGYAVAHDLGDYFECLGECVRRHRASSSFAAAFMAATSSRISSSPRGL
jgi:hypothetical protein